MERGPEGRGTPLAARAAENLPRQERREQERGLVAGLDLVRDMALDQAAAGLDLAPDMEPDPAAGLDSVRDMVPDRAVEERLEEALVLVEDPLPGVHYPPMFERLGA